MMTENQQEVQLNPAQAKPRDAENWAAPVDSLEVGEVSGDAANINVAGRKVVGPLQGFGRLWQKTYRVRLSNAAVSPTEVIRVWKERFPEFQPADNRFYPSVAGVKPGEVVLIDAMTPGGPVSTGVLVMYSDDESFTLMTPEGHPESGWVTFSSYEEDGATVAQVQSLARANDPIYEVAFRTIGSNLQEKIWTHVLTSLAENFGVNANVSMQKSCVDPGLQWSQVGNVRHNAQIRTLLYTMAAPVRWVGKQFRQ